jgi:hypothetical protein
MDQMLLQIQDQVAVVAEMSHLEMAVLAAQVLLFFLFQLVVTQAQPQEAHQ